MGWRLAEGLDKLFDQVNATWPNRSKISDGSIGDSAHCPGDSDHCAKNLDSGSLDVVTAIDITHDPAHGVDCEKIVSALIASRDSRIKYIIWNSRIISGVLGPSPWARRVYDGANPHDKHAHISIRSTRAQYDDRSPWSIRATVKEMRWELWRTRPDSRRVEESAWVRDTASNREARLRLFGARVIARYAAMRVRGRRPVFRARTRERRV